MRYILLTFLTIIVLFFFNFASAAQLLNLSQVTSDNKIITRDGKLLVIGDVIFKDGFNLSQYLNERAKINKLAYEVINYNRYGEAIIYAFSDKASLQEELIESGQALAYSESGGGYFKNFINAEQRAKSNKNGGWSDGSYKIHNASKLPKYFMRLQNKFIVVNGLVTNVAMNNSGIFINFGEDQSKDTTIAVWKTAYGSIDKQSQLWLMGLKGKNITARGMLESYDGPFMALSNVNNIWIN